MVNASFNRRVFSQYQAPSFDEIIQPLAIQQDAFDSRLATLDSMKQNLQTSFSRDKEALSGIQNQINSTISDASNLLLDTGDVRGAKQSIMKAKGFIQENLEDPNSEGYRILSQMRSLGEAQEQIKEMRKSGKYLETDLQNALNLAVLSYEKGTSSSFNFTNPARFVDINDKLIKASSIIKPSEILKNTGWGIDESTGRWVKGTVKTSERPPEVTEYILNQLMETDMEVQEYLNYTTSVKAELASLSGSLGEIFSVERDLAKIQTIDNEILEVNKDKKLKKEQKEKKIERLQFLRDQLIPFVTQEDPEVLNELYKQRYKDTLQAQALNPAISAIAQGIREYKYSYTEEMKNMSESQLKAFGFLSSDDNDDFDFDSQSFYENFEFDKKKIEELYGNVKPSVNNKIKLKNSDGTEKIITKDEFVENALGLIEQSEIGDPRSIISQLLPFYKAVVTGSYKQIDETAVDLALELSQEPEKIKKVLEHLYNVTAEGSSAYSKTMGFVADRITKGLYKTDYKQAQELFNNINKFLKKKNGSELKVEKLTKAEFSAIEEAKLKIQLENAKKYDPSITIETLPNFRKKMLEASKNTKNVEMTTVTYEGMQDENYAIKVGFRGKKNLAFLQDKEFGIVMGNTKLDTMTSRDNASTTIKNLGDSSISNVERIVTGKYAGGLKITGQTSKEIPFTVYTMPENDRLRNNFGVQIQQKVGALKKDGLFVQVPGKEVPLESYTENWINDYEDIGKYGTYGTMVLPKINQRSNVIVVPLPDFTTNVEGQTIYGVDKYRVYAVNPETGLPIGVFTYGKNDIEQAAFIQNLR